MPYNSAEAARNITLQVIELTLTISPRPPYTAGQAITLSGILKIGGVPAVGELIGFWIRTEGLPATTIGETTTDANGVAILAWTIPWKVGAVTIPCKMATWGAHHRASCTQSGEVSSAIAYPTLLQIFAPDTVPTGRIFEIYGFLSYADTDRTWVRMSGKPVTVYYNGNLIGDAITDADGRYSIQTSIAAPGTYTLAASFKGEGLLAAILFGKIFGWLRPRFTPAIAAQPLIAGR